MAQTCSSTSTSRFIFKAGARFRPTGYLSKTFGSTLAQAMNRHRTMPADSWTKQLRNVEKVSEGRRLAIAHCSCHQLSSVVSRILLSMEKMASQAVGKPFLPSVGSGEISIPWYFILSLSPNIQPSVKDLTQVPKSPF